MKKGLRPFIDYFTLCALFCVHCLNVGCESQLQPASLCCLPNPYWNRRVVQYEPTNMRRSKPTALVCSVLTGLRSQIPYRVMFVGEEGIDTILFSELNLPLTRVASSDLEEIIEDVSKVTNQCNDDVSDVAATFAFWFEDCSPIVYTLDSRELEHLVSRISNIELLSWLNSFARSDVGVDHVLSKEVQTKQADLDSMRLRALLEYRRIELISPLEPVAPDREVGNDVLAIVVCQKGEGYSLDSVIAIDSEASAFAMKLFGVWQGEVREIVVSDCLIRKFFEILTSADDKFLTFGTARNFIVIRKSKGMKFFTISDRRDSDGLGRVGHDCHSKLPQ